MTLSKLLELSDSRVLLHNGDNSDRTVLKTQESVHVTSLPLFLTSKPLLLICSVLIERQHHPGLKEKVHYEELKHRLRNPSLPLSNVL